MWRWQYDEEEAAEQLREFYEDVHTEFQKFGEIRNFKVGSRPLMID